MTSTFLPDSRPERLAPEPECGTETGTDAAKASFGGVLKVRVYAALTAEILDDCYARLHRKGAVVITWYALSYLAMVLVGSWPLGLIAGLSLALSLVAVGFNIQHDANHNAFFPTGTSRRLSAANKVAGWSLNTIGCSAKRWIDGHVQVHHSSPNVVGKDYDIELGPLGRLAPEQPHRSFHRYQHVYLWALYGFTGLGIMIGDVIGTIQDATGGDRKGRRPTARDYAGMVATKGLFGAAMIGLPLWRHGVVAVAIGAAGVLGLAGVLLGVVFQLAHAVEDVSFRVAADRPSVRWHEWQVLTSVDFCPGTNPAARLVTWYVGGLNRQCEHHLFPQLPHTAYPHVAPIVKATCADFGIRYIEHRTLSEALASHYRHVKTLGRPPA